MFTRDSKILSHRLTTPLTSVANAVGDVFKPTYNQIIKYLFANNEQGFAYDPNDLTTMFQDAAGTVPVTGVGQPVGLVLDKSKGLVLGPELILNGQFIDGFTGWIDPAKHWSVVNGRAYHPASANLNALEQTISSKSSMLKIVFDVEVIQGTAQVLILPSNIILNIGVTASKQITLIAPAGTTGIQFKRLQPSTAEFYIDNISIKELAGNHAYQTTSASRPIFRQNPIMGSELVTSNLISGKPATDTTQFYAMTGKMAQLVAGKTYKISYTVKDYAGTGNVGLAGAAPAGVVQQNHATNGVYSSIQTPNANGYFVFFTSATTTANFSDISVKEITGYRTDQNYLAFDGTDDFLQTNNIDFTATDKVSLFAGVRKLSDAAAGVLIELSSNASTTSGTFGINAPDAPNSADYLIRLRGGFDNFKKITENPAPITTVISARLDAQQLTVNNKINVRLNGITSAASGYGTPSTPQNFINQPLYIGRRDGTSLPFNGHIYGLIGVGKLVSESETVSIEKELAKRTGVTLSV